MKNSKETEEVFDLIDFHDPGGISEYQHQVLFSKVMSTV